MTHPFDILSPQFRESMVIAERQEEREMQKEIQGLIVRLTVIENELRDGNTRIQDKRHHAHLLEDLSADIAEIASRLRKECFKASNPE